MPALSDVVQAEVGGTGEFIPDLRGVCPRMEIWGTDRDMRFKPDVLAAIRDRFGPDLKTLHEVHHRLTPRVAVHLAKAVEPVGLYRLEDPTPAEDRSLSRLVRQHSTTPIAIDEDFNAIWDCKTQIEEELIDFIRVVVTYAWGITHVVRTADLAALYNVRTGFHGAPSHSLFSMAAQHLLSAWAPNFGIREYLVLGTPECDALFPSVHVLRQGRIHVSDAPGLGVDFDEQEAARYEFKPGSHPVVRLEDGTVWND